jgi:predicted DNA-binding transcriptional regulator YafY
VSQYRSAREVLRLYQYLHEHPGPHRTGDLVEATGLERRKLASLMQILATECPQVRVGQEGRQKSLELVARAATPELDAQVAMSLSLARQMLEQFRHSRTVSQQDQWIEALEEGQPAFQRAYVEWKRRFLVRHENTHAPSEEVLQALDVVLEGLDQLKQVSFQYTNFHGDHSHRRVCPLSLVLYRDEPFLVAREAGGRLRVFTLHAMWRARVEPEGFAYPGPLDYNPKRLFGASFGNWLSQESPQRVVLRFAPHLRNYVQRHRWHESQSNLDLPDGRTEVSMLVRCDDPSVLRFVLGFGADVELLEPASLRDKLRAHADKLQDLYG